MAKSVFHVVPNGNEWAVKREGHDMPASTQPTQKDAIEAARELSGGGDDIVIHRADGTIRERITYSASNNGNTEGDNKESAQPVKARDVFSVGSRVSWQAVLAGAVVAITLYSALALLAVAVGLSTYDHLNNTTFAVSAAVVGVLILLVSLFVGGFVASRTTAGESMTEAFVYGVLVWGTVYLFFLLMGSSLGIGLGNMIPNNPRAERTEATRNIDNAAEDVTRKIDDAAETVNISPTTAAWWGFVSFVLAIAACAGGAAYGAGPQFVIRRVDRTAQPQ